MSAKPFKPTVSLSPRSKASLDRLKAKLVTKLRARRLKATGLVPPAIPPIDQTDPERRPFRLGRQDKESPAAPSIPPAAPDEQTPEE